MGSITDLFGSLEKAVGSLDFLGSLEKITGSIGGDSK